MDKRNSRLPFTIRLFNPPVSSPTDPNAANHDIEVIQTKLDSYLPASYRTGRYNDEISVPTFDIDFLSRELLVTRINAVQKHLWMVGRPMPPRPLHYQIMHKRVPVITENMDHHLVWSGERIFIKPIPSYLLERDFWETFLLTDDPLPISQFNHITASGQQRQQHHQHVTRQVLASCARGFLYTYTALISYPSDFNIAQSLNLIPAELTWPMWKSLTAQLLASHSYSLYNPRFYYGELRLSRLNTIYRIRKMMLWRGYSKVSSHDSYESLIWDNFAILAAILGYVVIVLTAMQVGLATERLQSNQAFQNVSYGFTVLAMIVPLIASVVIFIAVTVIFLYNWGVTGVYERKTWERMGVEPEWLHKGNSRSLNTSVSSRAKVNGDRP